MVDTTYVSVTASEDGLTPVYLPNERWRIWNIDEIYTGAIGLNKYVPKLKDWVVDPVSGDIFIVTDIDTQLIATLKPVRLSTGDSLSNTDLLFGVGPGTVSDTYRVYLDTSVYPYILAVDARLSVKGSMCATCKIFKGADTSPAGQVISRVYDSNNQFVSNVVPLERIYVDSHEDYAVKTIPVCHTNQTLPDGELVTAVFYSDVGNVVSKRQLLIENTSFIRNTSLGQKYITHIGLESAFLDVGSDRIRIPINVPLSALNLQGLVYYSESDSQPVKLPVNGTKFSMLGLNQLQSTIIGQEIPMVLAYQLDANESAYGSVTADNKVITKSYTMVISEPNNAYTVKLFGFPRWVSSDSGYKMHWFLYNLDRSIAIDVTNKVTFTQATGPYDPKAFGVVQQKQVRINLLDVSPAFKNYVHLQVVDIVLLAPPSFRSPMWMVSQESSVNGTSFGDEALAILQTNGHSVNIDMGATDTSEWLDKTYYRISPMVNRYSETQPPIPTHIRVKVGSEQFVRPIEDFQQPFNLILTPMIYTAVHIEFVRNIGTTDLELGCCELTLVT